MKLSQTREAIVEEFYRQFEVISSSDRDEVDNAIKQFIDKALNDYTQSIAEMVETQKDYIKRMSPNTRFSTYPHDKSKEEGWSIGYEVGVSDAISRIREGSNK